jgi:UDP-N-acetylmuramate dehydrogenase
VSDLAAVRRALGDLVVEHHPIGPLTTYRVGGAAALYLEARAEDDLVRARRALSGTSVPVLVLGKGSNVLVADRGFEGLVVRLGSPFETAEIPTPAGGDLRGTSTVVVRAGAALGLPVLSRRTVEAGLTGLEWAVGVPGSVGGAVRMNAGGHGSEIAAHLVRYRWIDLAGAGGETGSDGFGEAGPGRLDYAYRSSSIEPGQVVLWAEFALLPGDAARGRAEISEIVRWRREHQPGGSNAGSVFTNPPGDSAGRLIEAAGLKGLREGTAAVSTKHANFIQADEGGSADDVLALMRRVADEVRRRDGVELHPEVRLIGFTTEETGTP